MKSVYEGSQEN